MKKLLFMFTAILCTIIVSGQEVKEQYNKVQYTGFEDTFGEVLTKWYNIPNEVYYINGELSKIKVGNKFSFDLKKIEGTEESLKNKYGETVTSCYYKIENDQKVMILTKPNTLSIIFFPDMRSITLKK